MNRDLQVKYVREMFKTLNGNYPHHLDFDSMDDDVLEQMFADLNEQIDERDRKRREEAESQVSSFVTRNPRPHKNISFFCHRG